MGAWHVMPKDDQLEGLLSIHLVCQTDTEEESGGCPGGCVPFFLFPALTRVYIWPCCSRLSEFVLRSGGPKLQTRRCENKSDYLVATNVLIYGVIKSLDGMSAGSGRLRATERGGKVGSNGSENDLNKPGSVFFSFSLHRAIFNACWSMDVSFSMSEMSSLGVKQEKTLGLVMATSVSHSQVSILKRSHLGSRFQ